jgi:predicted hydrocarbon binding protein
MKHEKMAENFLMKVWLETIENVVGENGLKSILHYAHLEKYIDNFPPDNGKLETPTKDAQALFQSLSDLFGQKGKRGLLLRAGREFARLGVDGRSGIARALEFASRLVPEITKMRLVLERIVTQYEKMYTFDGNGPHATLEEEVSCFLLTFKDYFESYGIESDVQVCNINVGMLQYVIEWITGHSHRVEEVRCRALGDPADVFKIWKVNDPPEN